MVRRTNPKDDEWRDVRDAKKRKQIQDRLAQRARRQRLRQAQLDPGLPIARLTQAEYSTSSKALVSLEAPLEDDHTSLALLSSSGLFLPSSGSSDEPLIQEFNHDSEILDPDLSHTPYPESYAALSPLVQVSPPLTVFAALYMNGDIQGITCAISYSSRTPLPKPHIPLPLHPTELQQMIVHPRWIDRLPFPRMRDSLIRLRGVVDEEELCKDFFTMPSFTIEVGCACWDPSGWRMEEDWGKKWGWLMI